MQQLSRKTFEPRNIKSFGSAESGAIFDSSNKFRYELWRSWDASRAGIVFIMLNPSTANDTVNDPTIRRCINFARSWNCGSLRVLNLFAYRATDHRLLLKTRDPVGPSNDWFIDNALETDETVVLAWGNHGAFLERGEQVTTMAVARAKRLRCFGFTKQRQPCHPLYLPNDSKLVKL